MSLKRADLEGRGPYPEVALIDELAHLNGASEPIRPLPSRHIDPVVDTLAMRRLDDAVAEYDERSLMSSLPPRLARTARPGARGAPSASGPPDLRRPGRPLVVRL